MTAKIYAIANRKGGCSKTTTTGALGAGLTRKGFKVLCVDMDEQADLTYWSGIDPEDKPTTFEIMQKTKKANETIIPIKRYDLIPADKTLSLLEMTVKGRRKMFILKEALMKIADDYDYILIDTPPSLGLATISALIASNSGVIVPADAGKFATKGLSDLVETINTLNEQLNEKIIIVGVLITRFSGRAKASRDGKAITKRFAECVNARLYNTVIRFSGDIELAIQDSEDIFSIPRKNAGVEDYKKFVDEFLEREAEYEKDENEHQ